MARKEHRAAHLKRAPLPAHPFQPAPFPTASRPDPAPVSGPRGRLAAPLRDKLKRATDALVAAGMLEPGELSHDEVIDCAEQIDEATEIDAWIVANILQALRDERGSPFAHLAFIDDQVETGDEDALEMVRDLARISGHGRSLRRLRLRVTGPVVWRGDFPPSNAVVEFELAGQAQAVPFVLYAKNAPGGLVEGLARVLTRPGDPRRFFVAGFDSFMIVAHQLPEKVAALNAVLAAEPTWLEVRIEDERTPPRG